ncbi:hypothetical protein [Nevskia ramosa]|nr:hypothetical protein [Nevskia ramosa]
MAWKLSAHQLEHCGSEFALRGIAEIARLDQRLRRQEAVDDSLVWRQQY